MTAIWVLTTRGRPQMCQDVLDDCERTGMTSHGIVYVDGTVEQYRNMRLPSNWLLYPEPAWGGIGAGMRWILDQFPDATQYGWLADDSHPQTPEWDRIIEDAAGDWCLSHGKDMVALSGRPLQIRQSGEDFGAPMCWGGKLVRAAGWWAVPGLQQAGIDTIWSAIIRHLHLNRFVPEVFCDHRAYRTGRRPPDPTDEPWRDGINVYEQDLLKMRQFRRSREFTLTVQRIQEAMTA